MVPVRQFKLTSEKSALRGIDGPVGVALFYFLFESSYVLRTITLIY